MSPQYTGGAVISCYDRPSSGVSRELGESPGRCWKGSFALHLLQVGTFLGMKPPGLRPGPGRLPCPYLGPAAQDGQAGASDEKPLAHLDLQGAGAVGTGGSSCCSSPGDQGNLARRPGICEPSPSGKVLGGVGVGCGMGRALRVTHQPGEAPRCGRLAEASVLEPLSLHAHLGRGPGWSPGARRWALWPEPSLHFSDAASGAGCGLRCV